LNQGLISRLIASGRGDGLRAQLLRGGVGVGALKLISIPLTLAASILLARSLGPEGFGQYAFVIALITTLSIPLAPALMQLTTRETALMHQSGELGQVRALLRWGNRHVLLGSALILVGVGGIAIWNAEWQIDDRWTLVLLSLAALPLLGLNAIRSGILAGLRRVVIGQFPDLVIRPLALLFVATVLFLGGLLSPLTAVAAFIAGAVSALIVGAVLLRRTFPETGDDLPSNDAAQHKQWRRAWMPFTLLVAASTLNAQIGILLLGWFSADDQVAAMQVAERGAMLVVLSLAVVNLVIGPHISQVHKTGDRVQLQNLSRYSARMALLVALPIAVPLIFFGAPILAFVFGDEYAEIATLPLAILAIAHVINVTFGSVGRLGGRSGYERHSLLGQAFSLVVVGVLGVFLIPEFGALGAAVSIAIGILIWNLILGTQVYLLLRIRPGVI
jgi:O-antigen/teichoic acid export membrane protein